MADLVEVAFPETEQDRAVHLGVAADVVVLLRREHLVRAEVLPLTRVGVAVIEPHRLGVPVLGLAGQEVAALEQQDPLARGREGVRQRASTGP